MFSSLLKSRVKKAGQPPGTPMYTGSVIANEHNKPLVTVFNYASGDGVNSLVADNWESCAPFIDNHSGGITWINIENLHNETLVQQVATHYNLHPLTTEDILNVEQRPKVEEFDDYYFVILRMILWLPDEENFSVEQVSIVFGKNFVLSFQEKKFHLFEEICKRLCSSLTSQRLRQQGPDYLAYRLIDAVVDQYFVTLEQLAEQIETLEEAIIEEPTSVNAHMLYQLKHRALSIRKVVWPMRGALSHLMQCDNELISDFTQVYLRDVYDHVAQAIDTLENFRDVLSGMMDIYLTGLTNRMNEVMKVLTIIATIFIPITFIASVYGMNFDYMPELHYRWSYFIVLGIMASVAGVMLYFFRRKKWL